MACSEIDRLAAAATAIHEMAAPPHFLVPEEPPIGAPDGQLLRLAPGDELPEAFPGGRKTRDLLPWGRVAAIDDLVDLLI